MIAQTTIDRIKSVPINEIIAHYVDLKPNGNGYKALSPFSEEKTPSFFVIPKKGIFKDFSSGLGGDAITFVMEKYHLTYPEAIKDICQHIGEQIEYIDAPTAHEQHDEKEELYKILKAAAHRYARQLLDTDAHHPAFRDVIDKRQFTADTILQWQIGYAPAGAGGQLSKYLTDILHEKALIKPAVELGLVKEKNGNHYDAFRDRVMYPIYDHGDRLVGFGGRSMAPDEYNPKYLNSPESRVFDKKQILYGLNYATEAIRERKYANLVEGYTDVISFHQADQNNTVGTCGTALTDEQCKLLKRYTDKVVLFPDPDPAGERSALRSIDLLMKHGFETAVVPLPQLEGRKIDPDELVRCFN